MIDIQNMKLVNIIPPAAILDDASATVLNYIDTIGYDYLTMVFQLGATDIAAVAAYLTECATSGGSYTAITGAAFSGTTGEGRLPTATDDNGLFVIYWYLGGAGLRYVKPVFTAGNGSSGTFVSGIAILSNGEQPPFDATTRGLTGQIIGSNS